MLDLATMAVAPALAAVVAAPMPVETVSTELSVLTYNVKGLPWPIAKGRAKALKEIGAELAQMRREGRQPDVVLIQEGFRGEVANLVAASGYRYWAEGPSRADRAQPQDGRGYHRVRYRFSGEGWGKFVSAGLHVLSDAPITDVRSAPYRYCAGLDCLANKGVMLARLALPGAPAEIDIVNTHLNSKGAAKVPVARSLKAHNLQTEELISFINAHRTADTPMLVGGDFNVRNAPDRYDHQAAERPFTVVSEFCSTATAACEGQQADAKTPWLRSQDLQAFESTKAVSLRPIRIETAFAGPNPKARLSDHDGYLVRYRLSWAAATAPQPVPRDLVEVKPTFGTWGVKVAFKR